MRTVLDNIRNLTFSFAIGAVIGCGPGGEGTTVNVGVTQTQTNDQSVVQNEGEAECNLACKVDPVTGLATGEKKCEGAATVVVAVTNLDECQSVSEVVTATQADAEAE